MRTVYAAGDRSQPSIGGAIASLVTPFRDDLLDLAGLREHVEWQILSGIDGLAVCSVAGEGPVLTAEERESVIVTCVAAAGGMVPVIAATGSHCTARTIEATRLAQEAGADAALITVPYYSKPGQKGILAHFETIASACDIPVIIDNRPAHTGIDLAPMTVEQLGSIRTVIGLADGSADISRACAWSRLLPSHVGVYTSNDSTALAFMLSGGAGSISDAANIAPRLTAALHHAVSAGNLSTATCLERRLQPLWQALAADGTAAALKAALALAGRPVGPVTRLPLVGVDGLVEIGIRDALQAVGVETIGGCSGTSVVLPHPLPL